MTSILPRFRRGPETFTALAAIAGGQFVDGAVGGVQPSAASSNVCVGIALVDAIPSATSQAPTIPGVASNLSINAGPFPNTVSVAVYGIYPATYAAATTFGQRMITAASGQITPAAATPDARQVMAVCMEPNGVGSAAVGATLLIIA